MNPQTKRTQIVIRDTFSNSSSCMILISFHQTRILQMIWFKGVKLGLALCLVLVGLIWYQNWFVLDWLEPHEILMSITHRLEFGISDDCFSFSFCLVLVGLVWHQNRFVLDWLTPQGILRPMRHRLKLAMGCCLFPDGLKNFQRRWLWVVLPAFLMLMTPPQTRDIGWFLFPDGLKNFQRCNSLLLPYLGWFGQVPKWTCWWPTETLSNPNAYETPSQTRDIGRFLSPGGLKNFRQCTISCVAWFGLDRSGTKMDFLWTDWNLETSSQTRDIGWFSPSVVEKLICPFWVGLVWHHNDLFLIDRNLQELEILMLIRHHLKLGISDDNRMWLVVGGCGLG